MRRLAALLLTGLLAACAGQVPTPEDDGPAWEETRDSLMQLNHWRARGKAGLRGPGRSESGGMIWSQENEHSLVYFSGPLGVQSITVRSDGRTLEVQDGDSTERWDLADPELMLEPTRWGLPVDALRFWLKGIPAPGEVQAMRTERGLLRELEQRDWQISYTAHDYFGPYRLPTRMEIRRGDNSIKLILREWTPLIK